MIGTVITSHWASPTTPCYFTDWNPRIQPHRAQSHKQSSLSLTHSENQPTDIEITSNLRKACRCTHSNSTLVL